MKFHKKTKQTDPKIEYLTKLGGSTYDRLQRLHCNNGTFENIKPIMLGIFGFPHRCLVCDKPQQWKDEASISDDVDPWFCSACCPICNNEEELFTI